MRIPENITRKVVCSPEVRGTLNGAKLQTVSGWLRNIIMHGLFFKTNGQGMLEK